jgi:putative ABC transport system permease protein
MKLHQLVLKELSHRKSQLISGLLAITLGIAVIVGIRSISVVSEVEVAKKLDNLGANIMVLPQGTNVDNYYAADIDAPTFPESYVEKIITSTIPGVDNLSPKLSRKIKVNNINITLTGILPKNEIASKPMWQQGGLQTEKLKLSCTPSNKEPSKLLDAKLQRKVIDTLAGYDCFVGYSTASLLNIKENSTIKILEKEFKVIKILPETGTVDDDRIFANLHTVQELLGTGEQVSAIEIMGCCSAISEGLLGKLRNILPDTKITSINQIVATQLETNKMMNKVSLVFLVIILFVGGISIGNYIWANVNERRKEIGILRMVGYSKTKIYNIFILKAILLGLLGGITGYVIGAAGAYFLGPMFAGLTVNPIFIFLPVSIAIAILISILGSVIPTYLAGKIEPFSNMQEV